MNPRWYRAPSKSHAKSAEFFRVFFSDEIREIGACGSRSAQSRLRVFNEPVRGSNERLQARSSTRAISRVTHASTIRTGGRTSTTSACSTKAAPGLRRAVCERKRERDGVIPGKWRRRASERPDDCRPNRTAHGPLRSRAAPRSNRCTSSYNSTRPPKYTVIPSKRWTWPEVNIEVNVESATR